MKTYFIVVEDSVDGSIYAAYKDGLLARFGIFNPFNLVYGTESFESGDDCEQKLRNVLSTKTGLIRIVRTVKI